jgi:hypothetical protein
VRAPEVGAADRNRSVSGAAGHLRWVLGGDEQGTGGTGEARGLRQGAWGGVAVECMAGVAGFERRSEGGAAQRERQSPRHAGMTQRGVQGAAGG